VQWELVHSTRSFLDQPQLSLQVVEKLVWLMPSWQAEVSAQLTVCSTRIDAGCELNEDDARKMGSSLNGVWG